MPFCPQCGIENPDTARYCDQCGAALIPVAAAPAAAPTVPAPAAGPVICPQCGASAIPGEAFCDNCGAPLSAPGRPAAAAPIPPYSANVPPQPVYPAPQSANATAPPAPIQPDPPPIFYQSPTPLSAPPPTAPPTLPPRHLPPLPDTPGLPLTQPISAPPPAPTAPRATLMPSKLIVDATGATIPLPSLAQVIVGRADAVSNFYPDVDLTTYGALDNGVGRRHLRLFVQVAQIIAEDLDSTNGTLINGQKLAAHQQLPLNDGDRIQLGKLVLRFQL